MIATRLIYAAITAGIVFAGLRLLVASGLANESNAVQAGSFLSACIAIVAFTAWVRVRFRR
jgi:uncharacterized membrane protein